MGKHFWMFDVDRCIGCESCVVACKQENNPLPGIQYRRLHVVNPELYPDFPTYRISLACNHCEDPICLKVCPAKAYHQEGGIVVHDPSQCIGCKYCLWACPYDAPQFAQTRGRVEKCNLCPERLKRGLEPACVATCPTKALRIVPSIEQIEARDGFVTTVPGFPADKTKVKLRLQGRRRLNIQKSEPGRGK